MARLRILADDLTGALDSAAAFAGELTVCLDHWRSGAPASAVEVVATATRDLPLADLPAALAGLEDWLADADVAFKKVDSLLRGNTFAELDHLARTGRFDRLVLAPALPAQGRHTVDGHLWVHGEPAAGASLRERLAGLPIERAVPDVRSDADLDDCLSSEPGPDLDGVPADQGKGRGMDCLTTGPAVVASAARTLWCGSAGLAHAWARHLRWVPPPAGIPPALKGPQVLISASHHPVSRAQWRTLVSALTLTPEVRVHRFTDMAALETALQTASAGAALAPAVFDLAPEAHLTASQAAELLSAQADLLAERLHRPGRLLVVGGDTLRALLDRCGSPVLQARASPWSGWGLSRWLSGRWAGVPVHSRSGAFGQADDLVSRWRAGGSAT